MTFRQAIRAGFSNYINFAGRAAPSEFWYWVLFTIAAALIGAIIDTLLFRPMEHISPLADAFSVLTFVPNISVAIRRLHDTDRSGWWWLLSFVPFGIIFLIVWWIEDGTPGSNRFGPSPPRDNFIPRPTA
jgi:uncharacterized membrane protein YhaH (DUF805 family)